MAKVDDVIPANGYSSTVRKTLILGKDGTTPATVLNPVYVQSVSAIDAASGTTDGVTVGNTTTVVLAAVATRRHWVVTNDGDEVIYLAIGANAVLNQGIRLNAYGGCYESTLENAGLAVNAICTSGGKNLCVNAVTNT